MSEFKVESGISMPQGPYGKGHPMKYPWRELGINDSFFVPGKTSKQISVTHAFKRTGFRFVARNMDGGVRVWRTA